MSTHTLGTLFLVGKGLRGDRRAKRKPEECYATKAKKNRVSRKKWMETIWQGLELYIALL